MVFSEMPGILLAISLTVMAGFCLIKARMIFRLSFLVTSGCERAMTSLSEIVTRGGVKRRSLCTLGIKRGASRLSFRGTSFCTVCGMDSERVTGTDGVNVCDDCSLDVDDEVSFAEI